MAQFVSSCPRCNGERYLWKHFWKWEWLARCGLCKGKGSVKAKNASSRRQAAEHADLVEAL